MYSMRAVFIAARAESALVDELSTRLGLALGMDSVGAISSNAIVLTTIKTDNV